MQGGSGKPASQCGSVSRAGTSHLGTRNQLCLDPKQESLCLTSSVLRAQRELTLTGGSVELSVLG